MIRKLSSIFNNEALDYAMYTIESRAIPHLIDGLKPVQRFVLYSTLKNAKNDFVKVASLGSNVSSYGYNHGEVSAQDALKLMASEWSNNIPLFKGRGNFGSRMVQDSAASRYVYAKMGENFDKYFKDLNLAPEHKDLEHIPPAFYIPVIPMVLANGVDGIATGFACKIPPHDPKWLKQAVIECLSNKEISEPVLKFPAFTGTIDKVDGKYIQKGVVEISGLTATVTEIPSKYDYDKYCTVLDDLLEAGKISRWTDATSDTFNFVVKFKRGTKMSEANVLKLLKLTATISPNINVIGPDGLLHHFDDARDLVKAFVTYRKDFLTKRIEHGIQTTLDAYSLASARVSFIEMVIEGSIILHGKKRSELSKELSTVDAFKDWVTELLSMTVDKMTQDEVERLLKAAVNARKELDYWKSTTPDKEFIKDLKSL